MERKMISGYKSKRAALCGLAAVVALCLSGCGRKGGEADNAALAKEHVYKMQEIQLPELYTPGDGNLTVQAQQHTDGKLSFLVKVNDWGEGKYQDNDYRVLSMDETGSGVEAVSLDMPEPPVSDQDGSNQDGEEGAAPETPDEEEDASEIDESVYYDNFLIDKNGKIYGVETRNRNDYTNGIYQRKASLVAWNQDGSRISEMEIPCLDTDNGEWGSVYLAKGEKDDVFLLVNGESYFRVKVSGDGTVSGRMPLSEGTEKIFQNQTRILPGPEGRVYVLYQEGDGHLQAKLAFYCMETDRIEEEKEIPADIISAWNYDQMQKGISEDLIYTTSMGISAYSDGDTEGKEKVNYINSDLDISTINGMVELSEETFLAFFTEDSSGDTKAGIFTYVRPEEIRDRKVLVLGGNYTPYQLKNRVMEFNRQQQEYRIVIKDYNKYNNSDNQWLGGITQLNNDIISGNMPDILITDGLPMENYAAKGLLADIGELIEKDEELSGTEFLQNVFQAYQIGGKLHYIIPGFDVVTMLARESLTGNRSGWTFEDMEQAVASMGENAAAFDRQTSRTSFLNLVMNYCGNRFVDKEARKCSFDSAEFVKIMEFAATLPEESEDSGIMDDSDWSEYVTQYRENRTLLRSVYLSGFSNLVEEVKGEFDEDFAFVGFPTEDGKGSYVRGDELYALSAKSPNQDAAWQFMRYYLTREYQDTLYSFPTRKDLFLEKAKKTLERPFWEDEDGEKTYYDYSVYTNGEEIILQPFTQEQLDKVTQFILSVDRISYRDETVNQILSEELEAFYVGQKTAQEVAGLIQNRVQLYLSENS